MDTRQGRLEVRLGAGRTGGEEGARSGVDALVRGLGRLVYRSARISLHLLPSISDDQRFDEGFRVVRSEGKSKTRSGCDIRVGCKVPESSRS
jgi:hypothetical protein